MFPHSLHHVRGTLVVGKADCKFLVGREAIVQSVSFLKTSRGNYRSFRARYRHRSPVLLPRSVFHCGAVTLPVMVFDRAIAVNVLEHDHINIFHGNLAKSKPNIAIYRQFNLERNLAISLRCLQEKARSKVLTLQRVSFFFIPTGFLGLITPLGARETGTAICVEIHFELSP